MYSRFYKWSLVFIGLLLQMGLAFSAQSVDELRSQGARVTVDARTSTVSFIGFDAAQVAQKPANPSLKDLSSQAAAIQYLTNYAELLGLTNVSNETMVIKNRDAADGRSMTRFKQYYQGVPIIAGELIVNQTALRQLTSISGKTSPRLSLSTSPVVTSQQAAATALSAVTKWYGLSAAEFTVAAPVLSIYDSRLLSSNTEPVALVWQTEVKAKGGQAIREFIVIDAISGAVLLNFNQAPNARNRVTYDANNTASIPGIFACNESSPGCSGGSADAIFAHRYAGSTYDYYSSVLGRDSVDGMGMTLISTVRLCPAGEACPYANAFWNGTQMSYGEGFAVGEDVVAHELTHGVTENESGLLYINQSGAINESLSDVFGELVQQNNASPPVGSNRWLMGENLSIGAIRSMSNPPAFNNPDKMTSPYYYTGPADYGGVHTNSGVNNKAAYLMVDGGTFNGRTVTALGATKTARIYYRAQTDLLTPGSGYLDLHNALYQSCQDQISTSGITSGDCLQVQNATLAVEMNLGTTSLPPSASVCPAGQSVTSTLFYDGLESGSANWVFAHTAGTNDWARVTGNAASGTYSLFGANPSSISDLTASMVSNIAVSAGAQLWFKHKFDLESTFDAGVLEYSTNSGSSWTDAGGLYAEGQNYNGVVSSNFSSPLAGRQAFTGATSGYASSRYNLSTLAGQNVRFRWRVGADSSVGKPGWFVDEVKVHVCSTAPVPPGPPTSISVVSYPGRVQVSFTAPVVTGSSSIIDYTVSCSAAGQTTRTGTGTGSPISVYGLTTGVAYSCSVTARNAEASSTASASIPVTGPVGTVDITPILMLLLLD